MIAGQQDVGVIPFEHHHGPFEDGREHARIQPMKACRLVLKPVALLAEDEPCGLWPGVAPQGDRHLLERFSNWG